MAATPKEIAPGLWRWTARHPEWHPGDFGAEVGAYALRAGDDSLLIDPIVPGEGGEAIEDLVDSLCDAKRLGILITIPYHAREAEPLWKRCRDRLETTIHGHPATADRFGQKQGFRAIEPGAEMPGGAVGYEVGKPRRFEHPIHLPSHDAIAFGDAVVGTPDGLRMWAQREVDEKHRRFYENRFAPTLEPLIALGAERILVTHGEPVLREGTAALEAGVAAGPWYHRSS